MQQNGWNAGKARREEHRGSRHAADQALSNLRHRIGKTRKAIQVLLDDQVPALAPDEHRGNEDDANQDRHPTPVEKLEQVRDKKWRIECEKQKQQRQRAAATPTFESIRLSRREAPKQRPGAEISE